MAFGVNGADEVLAEISHAPTNFRHTANNLNINTKKLPDVIVARFTRAFVVFLMY